MTMPQTAFLTSTELAKRCGYRRRRCPRAWRFEGRGPKPVGLRSADGALCAGRGRSVHSPAAATCPPCADLAHDRYGGAVARCVVVDDWLAAPDTSPAAGARRGGEWTGRLELDHIVQPAANSQAARELEAVVTDSVRRRAAATGPNSQDSDPFGAELSGWPDRLRPYPQTQPRRSTASHGSSSSYPRRRAGSANRH